MEALSLQSSCGTTTRRRGRGSNVRLLHIHHCIDVWFCTFVMIFLVYGGTLTAATDLLYGDDDSNHIVHLKSPSEVLESDQIWMVQLYRSDQSESKDVATMYKALAKLVRGVFPVAVLDITENDEILKQLSISSTTKVPAVYIIGDDKKNPIKVGGRGKSFPDIQMLAEALMEQASKIISLRSQSLGSQFTNSKTKTESKNKGTGKSRVLQLNGTNFDQLVYQNPSVIAVAFTAPWCGHCKSLLPEWEEAASKLDGTGALLGWVDATAEPALAKQYGVTGYPTIKIFPGGINKDPFKTEDYKYERTARTITQVMLLKVDETGIVPPTPELISGEVLENTCAGNNRICVIVALPHILDSGADSRNKYIERIDSISKKFRGSAFTFLWYEYTSQPALEQTLELTFGSPAVVALSMDRKAYVVYRSSFSEKGITTFLNSITNGKQSTVPLVEIPKIETVTAWDGKDGQMIEDEIPLSEIMGDDEL